MFFFRKSINIKPTVIINKEANQNPISETETKDTLHNLLKTITLTEKINKLPIKNLYGYLLIHVRVPKNSDRKITKNFRKK